MGIERARVVEVHAATSATGRAGAGYQVTDRLVLTHGCVVARSGPTDVRPAGTAAWASSTVVWRASDSSAALLEVDEPALLMWSPGAVRWGRVSGGRSVAVMAMGFPPASDTERPYRARDPHQFVGQLVPEATSLRVAATGGRSGAGDGMTGAALFAGATLVGVLSADQLRAVPVSAMAEDRRFVDLLVGDDPELALTTVTTSSLGFPILG